MMIQKRSVESMLLHAAMLVGSYSFGLKTRSTSIHDIEERAAVITAAAEAATVSEELKALAANAHVFEHMETMTQEEAIKLIQVSISGYQEVNEPPKDGVPPLTMLAPHSAVVLYVANGSELRVSQVPNTH